MNSNNSGAAGSCSIEQPDTSNKITVVRFSGNWLIHEKQTAFDKIILQILSIVPESIRFDLNRLEEWDTSLLIFIQKLDQACREHNIHVEQGGLPDGIRRLLKLASAVPEREGARRSSQRQPVINRIGNKVLEIVEGISAFLVFLGELTQALIKIPVGKARFRWSDLFSIIQECGPQALPIVSLISAMVGLILAFVGAIQLEMFGAEIFVANLVSLGMAREMGAMMAAVIMAGRTGAAFAARIGTMQVNEEIDALTTLGFSSMEFLVLPRMMAMILMMPLLCLYADLMGILGGAFVGVGLLNIEPTAYYEQTKSFMSLNHFAVGLIKSVLFGVIVALSGCLRGMQCGRSASAVGDAATSAVVTAIVWIVVTDALMTLIFNVIGM